MSKFTLDVYSHYVKVTGYDRQGKEALVEFSMPYAQKGLIRVGYNRFIQKILKVFAMATRDRKQFRFHIHQLDELINHLNNFTGFNDAVTIRRHRLHKAKQISVQINEKYKDLDYQIPIIKYLSNKEHLNVLTLQTGKGKTYCAIRAFSEIGLRCVLVIKGQFIDQWVQNVSEIIVDGERKVMVVRGSQSLNKLIKLAKDGKLEADFIIISISTLSKYMSDYESKSGSRLDYLTPPDKLFKVLEAGVRIVDEAHLNLHANFKLDLYTNIYKSIILTATLKSHDAFKNKIYNLVYPDTYRYKGAIYDRYIVAKSLHYGLTDEEQIRTRSRGRTSYSHTEFEKSILKRKFLLDKYTNMIDFVIRSEYLSVKDPGQKMLVLASTKDMCTHLTQHFTRKYPIVSVCRYIDEDDYTVLENNELIFSTVLSSGTAIDIKNLFVTLMTTAMDSMEANEQVMGRLRKLVNYPNMRPKFLYFVCDDIKKHCDYHERKKKYLLDKTYTYKELMLPFKL